MKKALGYDWLLLIVLLPVLLAAACTPQISRGTPPAVSLAPTIEPTLTPKPSTSIPATVTLTPTPSTSPPATVTPTPLPLLPPLSETTWATYTHPSGVSVSYPADWIITAIEGPSFFDVAFKSSRPEEDGHYEGVTLIVNQIPVADRERADPHIWSPNEGGYEVKWDKPIAVEGAAGWMYVWASYIANEWQGGSSLDAMYYNEDLELAVHLSTDLVSDSEALRMMQEGVGFDEIVAQRFGWFEQMVQSVRFGQ